MRVNARFEGAAEKQVAHLATPLNTSLGEVLRSEESRKLRFLGKHIGKGDSGRTDLSVNYKAEIGTILAQKFKPKT